MIEYPLASSTWADEEYAAIDRVVKSGLYTMGKEVSSFELEFADYIGSRYAVMVNSGSSANLLMIASMYFCTPQRLKAGDEVIVSAVSWSTTYSPLQQFGLKLKFVDIDEKTLNINLSDLEAAITEKTRAILAVNLLGNPNDFTKLKQIIGGREILLLEDNCESLGAVFGNKKAGTFGLAGTFSSFFSHHISTMEGGVIVTNDEELYHIMLCLRAHGWTRDLPQTNKVCGTKSDNPFEESFRFVLPGYNLRPLELSGAIGREQLKKLPAFIKQRRANAEYFRDRLRPISWLNTQAETGESSWFGFAMILSNDSPIDRASLIKKLEEVGIERRPIVAGNIAKNEVMKWFNYELHNALVYADWVDKKGFFVGNHHYCLTNQIDLLWTVLDSVKAN